MTAGELKALCLEFDKVRGYFPEDEWQGMAMLQFFLEKIGTPMTVDEQIAYVKEGGLKSVEEDT
jgi:hypothetical protein